MALISLDTSFLPDTPAKDSCSDPALLQALRWLQERSGAGKDFLGWIDLPQSVTPALWQELHDTAEQLRTTCSHVVCVGIGGSYLGAKAIIEALGQRSDSPQILYAGNNLSAHYLSQLLHTLGSEPFGIIYISKSGTTTEPAVAFRFLRKKLMENIGTEEAKKRIVAITDSNKGALREMAEQEGYKQFCIPSDVGGRFSVLSPVGLLPLLVAGIDAQELVAGASEQSQLVSPTTPPEHNISAQYAYARYRLYQQGKKIELLSNFEPRLFYLGEWWKQLFGESEGKKHKGIFPATVHFTTDLHSMGQWIQDGERSIFETILEVDEAEASLPIPSDERNLDKLAFLAGNELHQVNQQAKLGTILAHADGGVPVMRLRIPQLNEKTIGALLYFFEMAVAISGYLQEVNPFDQPGVEAYKKNMFALLGKPGYEEETQQLQQRIAQAQHK